MKKSKQHRPVDEIRKERETLDKLYNEASKRLSEEEAAARSAASADRSRKWKEAAPPVVAAWRLKMKKHVFEREGGGCRVMYTVKYADGTGNTFHPVRGAYDEVTGRITDRSVPMEPFFVHGLPFEHEPSGWLSDDHLYDIVRINPSKMPPIDRS